MPSDDFDAPRSAEFLRRDWPVFVEAVHARLANGAATYGDSSFTRDLDSLVTEIQQELMDVCGWSAIQWSRLEEVRGKVRELKEAVCP